ncbi:MAG: response regulator [Candidatus Riflebacteria bacterium]|nr:response regulator [Candidatus Riflebacteria bacterium]
MEKLRGNLFPKENCKKLLLIEDNPWDADFLKEIIEDSDYLKKIALSFELVHCLNLSTSRGMIDKNMPDVILLDLGLPESFGLDTLRKMRLITTDIPIIVLTGLDDEIVGIRAVHEGAQDYLVKGQLNSIILARSIIHGIERHRLLSQISESNKKMTAVLKNIQEDLEAAGEIQRSLLPSTALIFKELKVAWRFQPCGKVGGDLLNIFKLDDSHIGFYILDVAGHGVKAALLSVTLSQMLTKGGYGDNLLIDHSGAIRAPSEVFYLLDNRFNLTYERLQYFTITYGIIDLLSKKIRYSKGGHTPLIVQTPDSKIQIWEEGDIPLGLGVGYKFREFEKDLQPGTRIFLFSDGLIEARNLAREFFSIENLTKEISDSYGLEISQCLDKVMGKLDSWVKDCEITDDMTFMALELE